MGSVQIEPKERPVIGFTHHKEIIAKCKNPEERWYYIQRCASEFWSVEKLKSHIRAECFLHYGSLSNNFALAILDERTVVKAVNSFKDKYLLDFINIEGEEDEGLFDERVLSREDIRHITQFIMAMGNGFAYIGEYYRLIYDEKEYFVGILFYNHDLSCLVAIELKRGGFKPSYLGQLSFYLAVLDELEKRPDENNAIGLLLCREASKPTVELAMRDYNKSIGVAVYKTANDIPKPYQALFSLVNGIQNILSENEEYEQKTDGY